MNYSIRGIL